MVYKALKLLVRRMLALERGYVHLFVYCNLIIVDHLHFTELKGSNDNQYNEVSMDKDLKQELRDVIREELAIALDYHREKESLLFPEQAAKILGLKPQTLAIWRSHGTGPRWKKIGSTVRYDEKELGVWIEKQTVNN